MNMVELNSIFVLAAITIAGLRVHANSICSQLPYPQLCDSLTAAAAASFHNQTSTQLQLRFVRDSTIRVTLDRVQRAHTLVSAMDVSSFDRRAKLAWADCLEMYQDTVHQLNRSIGCTSPPSVQTWLSAALTNQQTCRDGFADFNLSSNQYFQSFPKKMFPELSKLLSNSLAINKQLRQATSSTSSSDKQTLGRRRRLLAHGFPDWLAAADRKLLLDQSSNSGQKADIVVAQDGSGNYKTISEAVAASVKRRSSGDGRFVIYVKAGVYKETIEIEHSMRNLMFVGDGIGATVVTGDKNYHDGTSTYATATFGISGDGFIARDMTFENTAGPGKGQAVAVRSGSDFSVFFQCSFTGYQDTLFVYSNRQFYGLCDIYGTQDFIFGNAVAVFQNCNLYVRKPLSNQNNYITAQGRTDPNQNTGIVIHNSMVKAAGDLEPVVGSYKTYLGRPWMTYSRTVFMKCSLDSLIAPEGWVKWSGNSALSTLYFGEYMNSGPGAGTGGRVKWPGYHVITSSTEAAKFTVGSFLDGNAWIPATGVPFTSGL